MEEIVIQKVTMFIFSCMLLICGSAIEAYRKNYKPIVAYAMTFYILVCEYGQSDFVHLGAGFSAFIFLVTILRAHKEQSEKKMNLDNITEEEVKAICNFLDEPYHSYMTGKWEDNAGALKVQIETTCTTRGDTHDGSIFIYGDGKVVLYKNNGGWGGSSHRDINPLPIIDYLRARGYEFDYGEGIC